MQWQTNKRWLGLLSLSQRIGSACRQSDILVRRRSLKGNHLFGPLLSIRAVHTEHGRQDTKESVVAIDGLKKPREPLPDECCGSNCVNCVWNIYEEERLEYEARLSNATHSDGGGTVGGVLQGSASMPALPCARYRVQYLSSRAPESSPEQPRGKAMAPILVNRELRQESQTGSVRHIEMDLTKLRQIANMPESPLYRAGDNLLIYVPNPPEAVDRCAKIFGFDLQQQVRFFPNKNMQGCDPPEDSTDEQEWDQLLPSRCSIKTLLTWYVDLASIPYRFMLRKLVPLARDASQRAGLWRICRPGSGELYQGEIVNAGVSFIDLLEKYPSLCTRLEYVPQLFPRLAPRYYTISSSPLMSPDSASVTVKVVSQQTKGGVARGVVSNYLAARNCGDPVCIEIRTSAFSQREELADHKAVLMIGAGTGIAPFRGFVSELGRLRLTQPSSRQLPPTALFFGCRRKDEDYLYASELQSALRDGIIFNLSVSFSREKSGREYVQDGLRRNADVVWHFLHDYEANVYVCGAVPMGLSIQEAITDIISERGGLSTTDAQAYVQSLKDTKRYISELF